MTKDQFVIKRTQIISKMLDNPNKIGIYPTGECFAELDDLYDEMNDGRHMCSASDAQILRDSPVKTLGLDENNQCPNCKTIPVEGDGHEWEVCRWSPLQPEPYNVLIKCPELARSEKL